MQVLGIMNCGRMAAEKGFTLLEVMVAVFVLSIGLLAAASMQILAVDTNASAIRRTEAVNLAQSRIEELMALEYSTTFTDPDLIADSVTAVGAEPFTDTNGNGLWEKGEPFTDVNGNGLWDPAHACPNPPPGYHIAWTVVDDIPVPETKCIRVYVWRCDSGKTTVLSCIKARE
ncbi:MAG: hypothetical protein DRH37_08170 [Deltaproteobacteria bacterium]|nr:MAG: hypothetical protein DRH37_08170 [Deltaproteobacteria bacterium]